MTKVITLTDKNFDQEVLKAAKPVLVDFWAPWCGPCLMMAPVLDKLSNDFDDKLVVAKLDVNEAAHQMIGARYQIQSIPALKLFKNGKVIKEYVGYRNENVFYAELNQVL